MADKIPEYLDTTEQLVTCLVGQTIVGAFYDVCDGILKIILRNGDVFTVRNCEGLEMSIE